MIKITNYCSLQDIITHFTAKKKASETMIKKLKSAGMNEGFVSLTMINKPEHKDHKGKHSEAYDIVEEFLNDNNIESVFIVPTYLLQDA